MSRLFWAGAAAILSLFLLIRYSRSIQAIHPLSILYYVAFIGVLSFCSLYEKMEGINDYIE